MSLLRFLSTTTPTTTTTLRNNHISAHHNPFYPPQHLRMTSRRTALIGLSVLTVLPTTQLPIATGAPTNPGSSSSQRQQPLPEFGSEPRPLDSTIRVKVPRPGRGKTGWSKEDTVEILMVDGIQVLNNDPVRFDVYVDRGDRVVGTGLGEFAGSLVDLARSAVGRKERKMGLSLGITNLVEEIGTGENLVVSLVPRTGDLVIGGVHVDLVKAE